jgi:uncharacterized protein (DUF488 family)
VSAAIYTIGHSSHAVLRFIELLQGAGIECLADVRSVPFSRRNPQFSQNALAASLKDAGIAYWFLGDALGARPKGPDCYEAGKVSYRRIAATPKFQASIRTLVDRSGSERIAIMCAEKEPLDCHRTILVGRALVEQGATLCHILADNRIEPHDETENRLLRRSGETVDLLNDRNLALARAYDTQGRRMAHSPS